MRTDEAATQSDELRASIARLSRQLDEAREDVRKARDVADASERRERGVRRIAALLLGMLIDAEQARDVGQ